MEEFDFHKYMIDLADLFVKMERSLCVFYQACELKMPKYDKKWQALQAEEEKHAKLFEEIRESIKTDIHLWTRGKFRPQSLQLMIESISVNTQKLIRGEIAPNYGLTFISDIENSLVESVIIDSFTCSDALLQGKVKVTQFESKNHRKILMEIKKEAFGE